MAGVCLALRREMSGRDDIPDSVKIKMNDVDCGIQSYGRMRDLGMGVFFVLTSTHARDFHCDKLKHTTHKETKETKETYFLIERGILFFDDWRRALSFLIY